MTSSRELPRRILCGLAPLLLLAGLCAAVPRLVAQEINATVTVNMDQLNAAGRAELEGFADEVQRYLSSTRWTTDEWEGDKVPMSVTIFLLSSSGGGDYGARIAVGSSRTIYGSTSTSPMLRALDNNWTFRYVRGQPLVQDPGRYDPLTGLLDFYAYLALGFDLDSYGERGGSAMFERAMLVAQRAQVGGYDGWSANGAPGEYTRYGLVRELTDGRFGAIRSFIFNYHFKGLDALAANRAAAHNALDSSLNALVRAVDALGAPSVILRVMNDAKSEEYAAVYGAMPDAAERKVWQKLIYIDGAHASVYNRAQGGR